MAAIRALDDSIVGSFVSSVIIGSMVGFAIACSIVCSIVGFAILCSTVCSLVCSIVCSIVWSIVGSIVGLIAGSIVVWIVGSAISTLELSLFLFFPFSVVDKSAVAGTMIYIPLISFPATLQEDGEVMEQFPFRNIVVCPPKSNWLIDRRESGKVGIWRTST